MVFYKLFGEYGIIENSEFKNINMAYKNMIMQRKNNEKENKDIENSKIII